MAIPQALSLDESKENNQIIPRLPVDQQRLQDGQLQVFKWRASFKSSSILLYIVSEIQFSHVTKNTPK